MFYDRYGNKFRITIDGEDGNLIIGLALGIFMGVLIGIFIMYFSKGVLP